MSPVCLERIARRVRTRLAEPCFDRLDFAADPAALFRALTRGRRGSWAAVLESARTSPGQGRYSIVAADALVSFTADRQGWRVRGICGEAEGSSDPLAVIERLTRGVAAHRLPARLPFAGGMVGYLGYEAARWTEPALAGIFGGRGPCPDICLFLTGEGAVVDHEAGHTWLFAHRERGGGRGRVRARLDRMRAAARQPRPARGGAKPLADPADVSSSLTRDEFTRAVRRIKERIRAGDIFQANLAQRISFPYSGSAWPVYERLRALNPSPFFGYLQGPGLSLACGSPERLVKLEDGNLQTRPIAGTRPRGRTARLDAEASRRLLLSPKERAEHVMLVDLERNDLGRVARYGSVAVDELCALEEYSHVLHIVSNVRARLRDGVGPVGVLRAMFPGGTITGTPKIRCVQILARIEPVPRGPYTGSLGYIGFSGNMDFNIIIRSLVAARSRAHVHAGAGIVADSSPEREYDETLHKAHAVLGAVFGTAGAARALRRLRTASRGA